MAPKRPSDAHDPDGPDDDASGRLGETVGVRFGGRAGKAGGRTARTGGVGPKPEDDLPVITPRDLMGDAAAPSAPPRRRRPARAVPRRASVLRRLLGLGLRVIVYSAVAVGVLVWAGRWVNPPITYYMTLEAARLGTIQQSWVALPAVAQVAARSVVAAEDANFCLHGGFDMAELRRAIAGGAQRGASTISQQVAKNVFLWPDRSWLRKALEAVLTPVIELTWTKARILEVYLNVAEFDTGVFGIEAAAQHHFGVSARGLSAGQAALLAAVLPDPKGRSAVRPSPFVRTRASQIQAGAALIAQDGRAACFAP